MSENEQHILQRESMLQRVFRVIFVTPWKWAIVWFCRPVTSVVLIRHAEKASNDPDTPISQAGQARADELVNVLKDYGVQAIFVTQYQRTKQTAQPLANHLGITPVERSIVNTQQYAQDLASEIRSQHGGQTVLVVGHTTSTSALVDELGAASIGSIGESEYDKLFIVTMKKYSPSRLVRAQYGH